MMRSRTAAALMRLKEMDRKYNIKRNEATRAQSNVSTDTSLEVTPREPRADSRKSPDVLAVANTLDIGDTDDDPGSKVLRASLKPKAPSSVSNYVSSAKSSPTKKSPRDAMEDLVPEDDPLLNLREEAPSIIKESLRSPTDLIPSLKSISSESKSKNQRKSAGSMDQPKSSDESSVATILSKPSEISEMISEVVRSGQDSSAGKSDGKVADAEERLTEASVRSLKEDVEEDTIEEAIRISEERSEVASELSRTPKENDDVSASLKEEQKVEYESDTFEQASSSAGSSSFVGDGSKEAIRDDSARSGVKQIMITVHMQSASAKKAAVDESPEETTSKEKKIIELVPPKIVQSTSECEIGLDEELSNYVRTTENVEELIPISLLKMSKQTTPRKHPRRGRKPRKNENTEKSESPEASDQERPARQSEKSFSSAITETPNLEKQKENLEEESSKNEDAAREEQEAEHAEDRDTASTSSEKLLREIPKTSDVTWTLRNLNRDAIDAIARRHRLAKDTKKCGTVVKLPSAKCEAPDSRTGSLDNLRDANLDQKKRKGTSKRPKTRKTSNRAKPEEKQSRFDCRHARKLRKQAAVIRQQQEREDIRNYLLELEHTRLEYGIGDPAGTSKLAGFKPLEFPKIAAFEKPDPTDESLKSTDESAALQERISTIRQWMKDQYTLYRDYSSLAKTVNAKYVPATLEDAKRAIRQLQKATMKSR
ncbi:uncharacterized protein LOC143218751 [Lasioglossum baleicum]|uniref:uncharacterized protein LOC143218751 n=1 Tax=Lasioglossum baleicum TaxID=434251 RepID=UPI003FCC64D4